MIRRLLKASFATAAVGVLTIGASSLFAPRAEAVPIFLCGPSYLWSCSGVGGPDILFAGTVCDRIRFERRTGLTCVPFAG